VYVEEHLREEDVVSPCSHSQWSAMRVMSLVYSSALSRPTVAPVLFPPVASPMQLFPAGAHCPSMRILPSPCARRTPASLPPASPASRPFRRTAALRPLRPSPPDTSALLRCRLPAHRHGVGSRRVAPVPPPLRRNWRRPNKAPNSTAVGQQANKRPSVGRPVRATEPEQNAILFGAAVRRSRVRTMHVPGADDCYA